MASTLDAGLGRRVAGALYDRRGSATRALALAASVVPAVAMWPASPGRVRSVAGRTPPR